MRLAASSVVRPVMPLAAVSGRLNLISIGGVTLDDGKAGSLFLTLTAKLKSEAMVMMFGLMPGADCERLMLCASRTGYGLTREEGQRARPGMEVYSGFNSRQQW